MQTCSKLAYDPGGGGGQGPPFEKQLNCTISSIMAQVENPHIHLFVYSHFHLDRNRLNNNYKLFSYNPVPNQSDTIPEEYGWDCNR